jgi:hypothetical protein
MPTNICLNLSLKHKELKSAQVAFSAALREAEANNLADLSECRARKAELDQALEAFKEVLLISRIEELTAFQSESLKGWGITPTHTETKINPETGAEEEVLKPIEVVDQAAFTQFQGSSFREQSQAIHDDTTRIGETLTTKESLFHDYETLFAENKHEIFDLNLPEYKIPYDQWRQDSGITEHTVANVMDYIHTKLAKEDPSIILPGLECQEYLFSLNQTEETRAKIPDNLKDGKWHHFPGSAFRGRGGGWRVPYGSWDAGRWHRGRGWAGGGWGSDDRILLFRG